MVFYLVSGFASIVAVLVHDNFVVLPFAATAEGCTQSFVSVSATFAWLPSGGQFAFQFPGGAAVPARGLQGLQPTAVAEGGRGAAAPP